MTEQLQYKTNVQRRILKLSRFTDELENILDAAGVLTRYKKRALGHVLRYVTSFDMKRDHISEMELRGERLRMATEQVKRQAPVGTYSGAIQELERLLSELSDNDGGDDGGWPEMV